MPQTVPTGSARTLIPVLFLFFLGLLAAGCGDGDPAAPFVENERSWEWSREPVLTPMGPYIDPEGRVWFADTFGRVAIYDEPGWSITRFDVAEVLASVWGTGAENVFVVGYEGLIRRWNGRVWSDFPSPSDQDYYQIHGTGPNDIFLAAEMDLFHFDGTGWQVADTGTTGPYYSVHAVSPTEVYLATEFDQVLRFDGSAWQEVPELGGQSTVSFCPTTLGLVAIGEQSIFRLEGGVWVDLGFPDGHLHPVQALGLEDGTLVVGAWLEVWFHADGQWTVEEVPGLGYEGYELSRAPFAGSDGALRLVTMAGTVHVRGADGWEVETPGGNEKFDAVWGLADDDIWAVGAFGLIRHFDGHEWTRYESGTRDLLTAVWASATDDVFAAGKYGVIIHYDGSGWSEQTNFNLRTDGLWGRSATEVWAVGSAVFRYDGTSWALDETCPAGAGLAVWGCGDKDVFIAGEGGDIWHFDGEQWETQEANNTVAIDFNGIWGDRPDRMMAVGRPGDNYYIYDGQAWQEQPMIPAMAPFGMHGSAWDNLYAVGSAGEVMRFDGADWTRMHQDLVKIWDFNDVWCSPTGTAYAVGDWGMVAVCRP